MAQDHVHVDLRLGRKPRNRRAANVMHAVHEIAEQRQKCVALGNELRRPRRIVIDNLDWSHLASMADSRKGGNAAEGSPQYPLARPGVSPARSPRSRER